MLLLAALGSVAAGRLGTFQPSPADPRNHLRRMSLGEAYFRQAVQSPRRHRLPKPQRAPLSYAIETQGACVWAGHGGAAARRLHGLAEVGSPSDIPPEVVPRISGRWLEGSQPACCHASSAASNSMVLARSSGRPGARRGATPAAPRAVSVSAATLTRWRLTSKSVTDGRRCARREILPRSASIPGPRP